MAHLVERTKLFEKVNIDRGCCTNFINKSLNTEDITFWPTHRNVRPEDYGDDGEGEGDGCGDDSVELSWYNLRELHGDSGDWKDFEQALKESQKFGYHSLCEMCFIGFPFDPDPNDGYATNKDFQELIAIYHQDAKKTKRAKLSVEEDVDDDKVEEGDNCIDRDESFTVKEYSMAYGGSGGSTWWMYKVIFDADGAQTDVFISNKDGTTHQSGKKIFVKNDDGNKFRLEQLSFEDDDWAELTLQ